MKNAVLTLFAAATFFTAKAQIITEAVYPGAANPNNFFQIQLTNGGDKYAEYSSSQSQVIVYNLSHTVYRTMNLALPAGASNIIVCYVSDALFDQNASDIEYLVQYTTSPPFGVNHVAVYRENGTLLYQRDTASLSIGIFALERIFRTSAGTKMIISSATAGAEAIVVGLPGNLPCTICDNGPSMMQSYENTSSTGAPYPNPAADFTTIPYALPEGERTGWLVLFDLAGQEVKRFQITNTFTSVTLSTAEIASGTYSYRIEAGQTVLPGEKLIIIH